MGTKKLQKSKQQNSCSRVFYPVRQTRKWPLTWDEKSESDLTRWKRKRKFLSKGNSTHRNCRFPQDSEKAVVVGQWRAMADSAKRVVAGVMDWCKLQTDIPVFSHDIIMVCTLVWISPVLNTYTKPDSWRANKVG